MIFKTARDTYIYYAFYKDIIFIITQLVAGRAVIIVKYKHSVTDDYPTDNTTHVSVYINFYPAASENSSKQITERRQPSWNVSRRSSP